MTHQPPIPPAATPPFPARPAPSARGDDAQGASESAPAGDETPAAGDETAAANGEGARSKMLGLGAAVGVGSAALLAASLYARRNAARRQGSNKPNGGA
jgi:hypothetical protein